MTAIGGVAEYHRSYRSSQSRSAVAYQIGVVFPDQQTALTAVSVLQAWQSKCRAHLAATGHRDVRVSAPTNVPTQVGNATSWLVTYRPVAHHPAARWFDAEGFVRDGDALSYLVIRNAGRHYDYPPGRTPIDLALAVAARALHHTR